MREHAFYQQAARYRSVKSLEFDGIIDWAAVPNTFGIDTFVIRRSNSVTVSLWVKSTKVSGVAEQCLGGRWFPTIGGGIELNEGGWRIYIQDFGGVNRALIVQFCTYWLSGLWIHSNVSFPTNSWVHVCVTYDGSATAAGLKMYWNSVLQATTTIFAGWGSEAINSNAYSHLMIGSRYSAWPGPVWPPVIWKFFEGVMDEWSLWRYELNASEVAQLYNCGHPIHPMHVGRPNGKTCSSHLRMGEYQDGVVIIPAQINALQARYPVTGVYRPGWYNATVVNERILEDVAP